uniref:Uncharacterized protein n=1 Tax=Timema monikensis TaxID=170555 RepID=A0A7R9HPP3_9NEOP|nr:unnamed protein product [Timema monikensis]
MIGEIARLYEGSLLETMECDICSSCPSRSAAQRSGFRPFLSSRLHSGCIYSVLNACNRQSDDVPNRYDAKRADVVPLICDSQSRLVPTNTLTKIPLTWSMGATVKSDSTGEARSCGVVASTPLCVLVLLVVQLVASSSSHTARLTFGTTFGTNVQNVQLNRTQTPPPPQVLGEPNGPRSARLTTFGVTNPKPQNNSNSRPAGHIEDLICHARWAASCPLPHTDLRAVTTTPTLLPLQPDSPQLSLNLSTLISILTITRHPLAVKPQHPSLLPPPDGICQQADGLQQDMSAMTPSYT